MKNNVLNFVMLLSCCLCFSQQEITWKDLENIKYTEKFFPNYDSYFLYPEFSPSIKDLEGKTITIKGYFLNIDPKEGIYILSKNPMASCFFCGQAGPESVMEVQLVKKYEGLRMDQVITFKGKLRLNVDDIYQLNYILEDAEIVE